MRSACSRVRRRWTARRAGPCTIRPRIASTGSAGRNSKSCRAGRRQRRGDRQRIRAETTLAIEHEDVEEFGRFLLSYDLLHVSGPQATAGLAASGAPSRDIGHWLLHNYLFMRIPLLRPDAFLTAAYPLIAFVYTRTFAVAIALVGFLGLYLVARQWDAFLATFIDMFTVQGSSGSR